jgi:hypothetical protein
MNSEVRYHRRRLADTAAALRMARTQVRREQGPRAQLASHQQQRLETVARHAASHSPFYRRWFAETGAPGKEPVQLQRLPVLDKVLLMEHFDELVCDPRLHRDQLLDWAGQLTRDQLYLDRYRVLLTSGSSGRRGCSSTTPPAGDRSSPNNCTPRSGRVCGLACRASGWPSSAAPPPPTSAVRGRPPLRSGCTGSWPCRSPCRSRGWSRRSTGSSPPT